MALTVTSLAAALRLGDGVVEPEEPLLSILTRLLNVGSEIVLARAPAAPDEIKDEAIIRLSGYLYDSPAAAQGDGYGYAWRHSGAGSLASSWIEERLGVAS